MQRKIKYFEFEFELEFYSLRVASRALHAVATSRCEMCCLINDIKNCNLSLPPKRQLHGGKNTISKCQPVNLSNTWAPPDFSCTMIARRHANISRLFIDVSEVRHCVGGGRLQHGDTIIISHVSESVSTPCLSLSVSLCLSLPLSVSVSVSLSYILCLTVQ